MSAAPTSQTQPVPGKKHWLDAYIESAGLVPDEALRGELWKLIKARITRGLINRAKLAAIEAQEKNKKPI